MNLDNPPHPELAPLVARPPWLIFLFLTAVLFVVYHDLAYGKQSIGDYNRSADAYISGVDQGSLAREIALLSLGAFAIATLASGRTKFRLRVTGPFGWALLSFVGWASLSAVWAEDLPLTLKRLAVFGILCGASVAIARRFSPREIILWTFLNTSVFLGLAFVAELAFGNFQPFAPGYRFAGPTHPNTQACDCVLLLLSGWAAADSERRWRAIFRVGAILGLAFLILSQARTGFAAAIPALGTYFAVVSSKRTRVAAALVLAAVLGCSILVGGGELLPALKKSIMLRRDDSSVDSFNGRVGVWRDLDHYIEERPILGFGYGGFWTPRHIDLISAEEKWPIRDSHSTYMEYLVTLGTVGLILYSVSLIAGIGRALRFRKASGDSAFAFYAAVLIFCALSGFLEGVASDPSLLMFLSMVILTQLAFAVRRRHVGFSIDAMGSNRDRVAMVHARS
jgi:exopolysaccharide production protein ExoQ